MGAYSSPSSGLIFGDKNVPAHGFEQARMPAPPVRGAEWNSNTLSSLGGPKNGVELCKTGGFMPLSVSSVFCLAGSDTRSLMKFCHDGIHSHGDYSYVDLKSMGNFPFDARNGLLTDVPKDFRNLDGKGVELKGMMFSRSASYEVQSFEFVYNIAKCCFGGPPKVQERVFVRVPNNGKVQLSSDQVDIIGKLHVRLHATARERL